MEFNPRRSKKSGKPFRNDASKIVALTIIDLVEKLLISGSSEECVDKIKDLEANG